MFLPFVLPRCTGGLDKGLESTPYLPFATLHFTFWHRHLQKCLVFLCPDAWDGLERKKHLHNSTYPIGLLLVPQVSTYFRLALTLRTHSYRGLVCSLPLGLPRYPSSHYPFTFLPGPSFLSSSKVFWLLSFSESPSLLTSCEAKAEHFTLLGIKHSSVGRGYLKVSRCFLLRMTHHSVLGHSKLS